MKVRHLVLVAAVFAALVATWVIAHGPTATQPAAPAQVARAFGI
ncbi:hypothetical protein [Lysobacter sp. KIS68-7]|nr:hypothetical protein [Lysobacter sp. KIS68-7]